VTNPKKNPKLAASLPKRYRNDVKIGTKMTGISDVLLGILNASFAPFLREGGEEAPIQKYRRPWFFKV